MPHITKNLLAFGDKMVGVLTIEPHRNAPVVALKVIGNDVKEGLIYFRYVGETRPIKPGELRQIIAMREQRAVAEFSRRMMGVATGDQATLNLETGEVQGAAGTFVIDETLLPQLQFIREGDFSEVKGAPTLRLVGDVQPIDKETGEKARIIRDAVTPDAAIRNFLTGEQVSAPIQYVHAQAHFQRKWLPVWYYARQTGMDIDDVVEDLRSQVATQPASRDAVVQRLRKTLTAHKAYTISPASILKLIAEGDEVPTRTQSEILAFANTIMGLLDGFNDAECFKPVLLSIIDNPKLTATARSSIYRAISRIDEILHR